MKPAVNSVILAVIGGGSAAAFTPHHGFWGKAFAGLFSFLVVLVVLTLMDRHRERAKADSERIEP